MPLSLPLQVPWPPLSLLAVLVPLPLAALLMFSFASTRRWQPAGKHVLVEKVRAATPPRSLTN